MVVRMSLLVLCCGCLVTDNRLEKWAGVPTDNPAGVPTDNPESFSFEGLDLLLVESEGFPRVSDRISLSFPSETDFNFSGECNSFGGGFMVEDNIFIATEVYGTEVGCNSDLMAEDEWLVGFFVNSPTYSYTDDNLIFGSADATLTFANRESQIPNTALEDTTWEIDSYYEGDIIFAMNLPTTPSMVFGSDGSINVNTGCNDGMGQYSVAGDTMTVTMDAYTDAFCEGDVNAAESHIVRVFMGPTLTFSISENRLTLMNDDLGISATAQ